MPTSAPMTNLRLPQVVLPVREQGSTTHIGYGR
jgi:hypothetical protein